MRYYYLHTNGDLIAKNPVVVDSDPSYFDSPFVKKHWLIDTDNRETGWRFLLEALHLGARLERVKELVSTWSFTKEDSFEFVSRVKPNGVLQNGLKLFIAQVLGMEEDKYWDEFKAWGEAQNAHRSG